jgi:four helix bundle protein
MKKNNIIQEKSFDFALQIIDLYKDLRFSQKEFVLSKQILRSGTSIGANVEEGIGGFSRKDFAAKLNIAYKESRETRYWLRLLFKSQFINHNNFNLLISECDQIIKILTSILLTLKNNARHNS